MLRKQRKRLVCPKGPSLGYVRARSLLRQVPQLQLRTPVSENTTRTPSLLHCSWNSSSGQDITTCDSESTSRAFIVDDFDKCVIRRKSKNFTRSGSSYPPLTGCLQFHYVNVIVLIKFLPQKHSVFTLIIISSP